MVMVDFKRAIERGKAADRRTCPTCHAGPGENCVALGHGKDGWSINLRTGERVILRHDARYEDPTETEPNKENERTMTWKDEDTGTSDSLDLGFNAEDTEPMSFDLLPEQEFTFLIKEVAMKESQKSTPEAPSKYLKLTLVVTDEGPFKGRYVWDQMTTHNPNPEAEKIGRAKIAAVFKAAGVGGSDASQLVQREVRAKVGVKPARDGFEASNNIKSYKFLASVSARGSLKVPFNEKPSMSSDAPAAEPTKRKPPPFVKG